MIIDGERLLRINSGRCSAERSQHAATARTAPATAEVIHHSGDVVQGNAGVDNTGREANLAIQQAGSGIHRGNCRGLPIRSPGRQGGIAINHTIGLEIGGVEVVELLVAQGRQHQISLGIREIGEGGRIPINVRGGRDTRVPRDHWRRTRRTGTIAIINALHKEFALGGGGGVPIAVLHQGHIHGVERIARLH